MKSTELKQLIKESIQEYIREIDEAGSIAALEAKIAKTQEAIELRERKMNMEGIDEAYHDMLDKGKMKELESEIKLLKKSADKYDKQLKKMQSKKSSKPESKKEETQETIDEILPEASDIDINETETKKTKEQINESFVRMQKRAGLL